jgi:hypothetical protein
MSTLGAFVELAAIVDTRLRPQAQAEIAGRVQGIQTADQAGEYLMDVATRLEAAGVE